MGPLFGIRQVGTHALNEANRERQERRVPAAERALLVPPPQARHVLLCLRENASKARTEPMMKPIPREPQDQRTSTPTPTRRRRVHASLGLVTLGAAVALLWTGLAPAHSAPSQASVGACQRPRLRQAVCPLPPRRP
jgi:ferric-dicitrate binding protein FerR (iron transport regulator)